MWTDEKIEKLKSLRLKGKTYTEIGKILGKPRSAISGKLFRLGLTDKENSPIGKGRAKTFKLEVIKPTDESKSLADLKPNECRYPMGEKPYSFCGKECTGSYCGEHQKLCYTGVKVKGDYRYRRAECKKKWNF